MMPFAVALLLASGLAQDPAKADETPVVIKGFELRKLADRLTRDTGLRVRVEKDDLPYPLEAFKSNHTTFDILHVQAGSVGEAAKKGCFVDLARVNPPVIDPASIPAAVLKFAGEFPPGSRTIYGVPCWINVDVIAYRKDWFQDPAEKAAFKKRYGRDLGVPGTWEDLAQIAEFFTRPAEKKAGLILPMGVMNDQYVRPITGLLQAWGGSWGNPKTFQAKGYVDGAASVRTFEFYVRLQKCGGDTVEFGKGRTAMFWHSSPETSFLSLEDADKEGYLRRAQVGYFALPRGKEGRAVGFNAGVLGVSQLIPRARQERAFKFLRWFLSSDVQEQWAREDRVLPVRLKTLQTPPDGDEAGAAVAASVEFLQPFWNAPGRDILVSAVAGTLDEVTTGGVAVPVALKTLAETFEVVFKDNKLLK